LLYSTPSVFFITAAITFQKVQKAKLIKYIQENINILMIHN
jgi:hypothetical protein